MSQSMNLYVHFPFCRRKCSYCALFSAAGRDESFRDGYAKNLAGIVKSSGCVFRTVYFGGGTPSLCNLDPLFDAIGERLAEGYEWTVELNPLDADPGRLENFRSRGANRVSMGVQSLDDSTLADMGRGHTAAEAIDAFKAVRDAGFDNAGIDLIAGYPSSSKDAWKRTLDGLADFAPDHCSVYSLIREKGTLLDKRLERGETFLPGDDAALGELETAREVLSALSLDRYEISSYAKKGFECRHNLAVWRGEDYIGLGAGAHGRIGLFRSRGTFENPAPLLPSKRCANADCTELGEVQDALERALFRLRTREGLDLVFVENAYPVLASRLPEWKAKLLSLVDAGILSNAGGKNVFALSGRGTEVCDAVLSELI